MAPASGTVAKTGSNNSPYQLDVNQVQRAAEALLQDLKKTRTKLAAKSNVQSLIPSDDASSDDESGSSDDREPLWLIVTTKKHVVDKKRLKPNKIQIPHSLHNVSATTVNPTRICLITADPQRQYKDIVASPAFPEQLRACISRVISISKLKAKYKSFESRRQLHAQHDIFLADDRIVTMLPETLGKVFYKGGEKRPIPVELAGNKKGREKAERDSLGMKRKKPEGNKTPVNVGTPESVAKDIERALSSALVHLSPSVTTAVKVAHAGMTANAVRENIEAVCNGLVERFITQGWRNVRSIHVKGPNSMALPVWLASELWVGEEDVLDEKWQPEGNAKEQKTIKGNKRKLLAADDGTNGQDTVQEKKRKSNSAVGEKGTKKRKGDSGDALKSDVPSRKESLKQRKAQVMGRIAGEVGVAN